MTDDGKDGNAPLHAAVVGVGRMGQHHARNYAGIRGFRLVAVVDQNPDNREKVSAQHHCHGFATVGEMLAWSKQTGTKVDAASVAVPTVFHRPVAEELMNAGRQCFD